MKIVDGRGANKLADSIKNKALIEQWFKNNPAGTITACCKELNLSYTTVRKHLNTLIKELNIQ